LNTVDGGSGGFIYIESYNKTPAVSSITGLVSVKGGYAIAAGQAGSGGRIHLNVGIDFEPDASNLLVAGGTKA